jgi:hypothetical protein
MHTHNKLLKPSGHQEEAEDVSESYLSLLKRLVEFQRNHRSNVSKLMLINTQGDLKKDGYEGPRRLRRKKYRILSASQSPFRLDLLYRTKLRRLDMCVRLMAPAEYQFSVKVDTFDLFRPVSTTYSFISRNIYEDIREKDSILKALHLVSKIITRFTLRDPLVKSLENQWAKGSRVTEYNPIEQITTISYLKCNRDILSEEEVTIIKRGTAILSGFDHDLNDGVSFVESTQNPDFFYKSYEPQFGVNQIDDDSQEEVQMQRIYQYMLKGTLQISIDYYIKYKVIRSRQVDYLRCLAINTAAIDYFCYNKLSSEY